MKLSARNKLAGKIVAIKKGPVNSQVEVDIGGGTIVTSMITTDAVEELDLAEGRAVRVVIKASQVMLATD
ncbi:MAG: TOBE domain-containing protein [Geminicoccaceae bacterium]|nr:TOBE domain-containing protein [Geminicoccaceae bacterium]